MGGCRIFSATIFSVHLDPGPSPTAPFWWLDDLSYWHIELHFADAMDTSVWPAPSIFTVLDGATPLSIEDFGWSGVNTYRLEMVKPNPSGVLTVEQIQLDSNFRRASDHAPVVLWGPETFTYES